jgi:flavin-dependent dehydrogenase
LRDLAEKYGVTIRLGAEVINIEPEEGIIEILGGEKAKKDLWILADGCHVRLPSKPSHSPKPTISHRHPSSPR